MKIPLKELVEIQLGLRDILTISLSARIAYRLAKFSQKIDSEMKALEKTREVLLNKYAKKDKDGQLVIKLDKDGNSMGEYDFLEAKKPKFVKEYNELAKESIEVEFTPVRLKDLGNAKLKPVTLIQLKRIIKE